MPIKRLMTIGLLTTSLNAVAQFDGDSHFYQQTGFYSGDENNFSQQFNDRFNNDAKREWLQLASENYISKAQAIDIAKQRSNGKILSAKLVQREQHAFYKIKVLTDQGRIKTLRVNAKRR